MQFTNDLSKAETIRPYNLDKNRNATLNEVAKQLILNAIESAYYDWGERVLTSHIPESGYAELRRHVDKHVRAISKRFGDLNLTTINYKENAK